jgi:hypothetical protein
LVIGGLVKYIVRSSRVGDVARNVISP